MDAGTRSDWCRTYRVPRYLINDFSEAAFERRGYAISEFCPAVCSDCGEIGRCTSRLLDSHAPRNLRKAASTS
jgi:hypothetical protein